ncbi:PhoX family phosphatase [Viridibacterium curvum]|uniref:PhoX family phosphatase n=1 Tax=Viridibacterium curvum TaxID=1101404 RepID=A0ABP9R4Y8_9RHOO
MNQPTPPAFDDEDNNTSANPHFDSLLAARISRRNFMGGAVGTGAMAVFGSLSLPAMAAADHKAGVSKLGFKAIGKSLADKVVVADGYTYTIIYALGDPLNASTPAYKNDGTDTDYENRAGDHHDGMEWFGLSGDGKPSWTATERGLLGMNHEATTDSKLSSFFLHADGGKMSLPRPASEVDKELAIHGVSVVEVRKARGSKWAYVPASPFNFRLTTQTELEIAGPARGDAQLVTKYSPDALRARGTLNNCGTGRTPWGTLLTGEENWNGYFARAKGDDAARGNDKSVFALKRYGRAEGSASRHGWESAGNEDKYVRWSNNKTGTSADGSDDYRNEMNTFGYVVEIDPYDRTKKAKKRTALGRFAHESAAFGKVAAGQPLTVYMGDDARNEYIYKFVSNANWNPADANAADRLAVGAKYLDDGKLFVARFNADGTGEWLELNTSNPALAGYSAYRFANQADICINTRIAGDAAGATKMDRPEWCAVHPVTGEVYYTLTNNNNRSVNPSGTSQLAPDSANPRAYTDVKDTATLQSGNPNGHILRIRDDGNNRLSWDVYLFGAEAGAPRSINLSGLTPDQDFSSPDGIAFSQATGICWIQTDDSAYTDVSNCMLLAATPGKVGDGEKKTLSYKKADGSTLSVDTFVGAQATDKTLKRFLVGPVDCEITGLCETPDGKALFINIQHPGETTSPANIADPAKYTSQWPANAGYGPGKRPRSATIVITKKDGGRIGS